jgi:hypothetical protein
MFEDVPDDLDINRAAMPDDFRSLLRLQMRLHHFDVGVGADTPKSRVRSTSAPARHPTPPQQGRSPRLSAQQLRYLQ